MEEEYSEDEPVNEEQAKLLRLVRVVVPALLVIGICVFLGVCLKKKHKKAKSGNYSEMYEEQDAIESGL